MESTYKKIVEFIRELYQKPEGFIPLHAPVFRGNEMKYLQECIDSTYVSSVGRFVDEFEEKMAQYTGAKKAVVCVNGTNALHLALLLVGVERGTEVITQPLTFIATANAITYCGASPVFLDVDMDTLGLSPNALKTWLESSTFKRINNSTGQNETINKTTGKRISACVPMHTFGFPARIDEIIAVCDDFNIPVVEDAAESLGSFYKGQHTGTFGKIGVLSFNGNKVITTGGGGMMLFMDENLAKRAKHLTTQSRVSHSYEFIHDEIGFNLRMPNINAALGLAQLEQIPLFLQAKRQIANTYQQFFKQENIPNLYSIHPSVPLSPISFFTEPLMAKSNYWLNCILFQTQGERDDFLKYTNENGVLTRPVWRLMTELTMYEHCETDKLSNAFELAKSVVNLPSSVPI